MEIVLANKFLSALGRVSLEGAILILLVLAIRRAFKKHLTPNWRSALWMLVVVRLLLPFSLNTITSVFNLLPQWGHRTELNTPSIALNKKLSETAQPLPTYSENRLTPPAQRAIAFSQPPSPPEHSEHFWIFICWFAGASLIGGRIFISSVRFWKKCNLLKPLANPVAIETLELCCQRMAIRNKPVLLESRDINSPALHGFLRPRLLLPQNFTQKFSAQELRFIFYHELAHLKRLDLIVNWIAAALQAIHWFNPFVWIAFNRWRHDRELACDALALDAAGAEWNREYGKTILRLLENFSNPACSRGLVGISEDKRQLHHRIEMIASYAPARRWPLLAIGLITGLAVIGLTDAMNSSGSAKNSAVNNAQTKEKNMNITNRIAQIGVAGLLVTNTTVALAAESRGTEATLAPVSNIAGELVGEWVLVGTPDHVGDIPSQGARYKFYTGKNFCMTQSDPKTKVVMFHHGGSYAINGDEYTESLAYANPTTLQLVGKTNGHFKIKVEGNLMTLVGADNNYKEAWKRVTSSKSTTSPLAKDMLGAWILVGTPDHVGDAPKSNGRIKFITPGGWCDTESDFKTSIVMNHHGGTWKFDGNSYVQTVEYANPGTLSLVGRSFKFQPKDKGDTLTLIGIENPWKEVWKRLD